MTVALRGRPLSSPLRCANSWMQFHPFPWGLIALT